MVYRPTADKEGGGKYQKNPFWDTRRPLRPFMAVSHIYYFFPKTKKLFSQFDTDQN